MGGGLNTLYMIIAVFAIIMVLLSPNKFAEEMEKKKKRLEGKDPLIVKIEDYNAKESQNSVLGMVGTGNPNAPISNLTTPNAGVKAPNFSTGENPYLQNNPYRQQNLQQQQNPYNDLPVTPAGPDQPAAGYYPPTAPTNNNPNASGGTAPQAPDFGGPRSEFQQYLRGGQPVEFSGVKVYTRDQKGQKIPMPDGDYAMHEGDYVMHVRGGRKVLFE